MKDRKKTENSRNKIRCPTRLFLTDTAQYEEVHTHIYSCIYVLYHAMSTPGCIHTLPIWKYKISSSFNFVTWACQRFTGPTTGLKTQNNHLSFLEINNIGPVTTLRQIWDNTWVFCTYCRSVYSMYRLSGKEGGEGVLFHCANAAKSGTGWPPPIAGWLSGQHVYCTYAASPCNPIATSL